MNIGLYSLNAFHAFESAARHQSFTKAGKELHVTQGAVSQQIKQLESQIGFDLFHRQPRKLVLTKKGEQLAAIVRSSLHAIQEALEELQGEEPGAGVLRISVLPSFASKWLIPRLKKFNTLNPHIKLELSSEGRLVDLHMEDVDVAIRYGKGDYPGLNITLITKEEVFPVCSPSFLEEKNPPRTLEDLKDYVLIQDIAEPHSRYMGIWETWLEKVGVTGIDTSRGTQFNRSDMVMDAAVLGQGIALGRSVLIKDDIAQGRLVRLFDIAVDTELSYYLVCKEENIKKEKIRVFREWLQTEIKETS